jgi:hypothetical protein
VYEITPKNGLSSFFVAATSIENLHLTLIEKNIDVNSVNIVKVCRTEYFLKFLRYQFRTMTSLILGFPLACCHCL